MKVKRISAWLQKTRDYVEIERLSGDGWMTCRRVCVWRPPTDVYEDKDGLVVRVEVAGMRTDDFSISLEGRTLVIAGARTDPAPKRMYHQMEIRFGEFRAEVYLPWPMDAEDVEARYEDGFLEVRLPRPQSWRTPVVEVEPEED